MNTNTNNNMNSEYVVLIFRVGQIVWYTNRVIYYPQSMLAWAGSNSLGKSVSSFLAEKGKKQWGIEIIYGNVGKTKVRLKLG